MIQTSLFVAFAGKVGVQEIASESSCFEVCIGLVNYQQQKIGRSVRPQTQYTIEQPEAFISYNIASEHLISYIL